MTEIFMVPCPLMPGSRPGSCISTDARGKVGNHWNLLRLLRSIAPFCAQTLHQLVSHSLPALRAEVLANRVNGRRASRQSDPERFNRRHLKCVLDLKNSDVGKLRLAHFPAEVIRTPKRRLGSAKRQGGK